MVAQRHATFTIDDLRAAFAKIEAAKRTIVCPPDLAPRVQELVDAHNLAGLLKVEANEYCPPNRIFVINYRAIDDGITVTRADLPSEGDT